MSRYGVIATTLTWLTWTTFAGSSGALCAEATAKGAPQGAVYLAAKSSASNSQPTRQGHAIHSVEADAPTPGSDRPPLDLSLPKEALETVESPGPAATSLYRGLPGLENAYGQNDPLRQMRRAFPALLAPHDKDNPVRIKGRLLMDQAKDRSPDAVDGGQIIIEVQTE